MPTWLPAGGSLPVDAWERRHAGLVALLWLHVPGVAILSAALGSNLTHAVSETSVLLVLAVLASWHRLDRRLRSAIATGGLLTASAVLVHLTGGVIEVHFHFFVMVALITLYQDWLPFLLAIGYVILQHGVVGMVDPTAVYNHPDAWSNPWKWAAIHGGFVLAASAANVVSWRVVEAARLEAQAAEQRLSTVLESVTDAFVALDASGRIAYLNRTAARALGVAPAEALGRHAQTALSSPLAQPILDGAERALIERNPVSFEASPANSASSYEVHASPTPDDCVAVSFRDITARKQAEVQRTELARAQAAQAESEVGRERSAFLAEASRQLSASLDDSAVAERLVKLAVPAIGDACTVTWIGADGIARSVSEGAKPAPNMHHELGGTRRRLEVPLSTRGEAVGTLELALTQPGRIYREAEVALASDLATRATFALENARLYRQARAAVQERDDFLTVAAHELKTPVATLHGYAELLRRATSAGSAPDPLRLDRTLAVMQREAAKLSRLVNQLLDIARIEAGRLRIERSDTDLVALVGAVIESARLVSGRSDIVLDAPPTACISADPLRIEQVVRNLVDNATKYSSADTPIYVSLTDDGDFLTLAIRDYGKGVPPEKRAHIFDRFYQAHAGDHASGMGLGLWVCKQIVALHGGDIRAEFPAEGGTRFVVRLPRSEQPHEQG